MSNNEVSKKASPKKEVRLKDRKTVADLLRNSTSVRGKLYIADHEKKPGYHTAWVLTNNHEKLLRYEEYGFEKIMVRDKRDPSKLIEKRVGNDDQEMVALQIHPDDWNYLRSIREIRAKNNSEGLPAHTISDSELQRLYRDGDLEEIVNEKRVL
jgi:hypothetical protein